MTLWVLQLKLIPPLIHYPTALRLANPLPMTLPLGIILTLPVIPHPIPACLLRVHLTIQTIPLPVLTLMIHQLISLHHLLFHQNPVLHLLQILKSHFPLLARQQNKLACLISSQKCHLVNSMQDGGRENEIMQRGIEKNMKDRK